MQIEAFMGKLKRPPNASFPLDTLPDSTEAQRAGQLLEKARVDIESVLKDPTQPDGLSETEAPEHRLKVLTGE